MSLDLKNMHSRAEFAASTRKQIARAEARIKELRQTVKKLKVMLDT